MLVTGLLGARITASADCDAFDHARSGMRMFGAFEAHGTHLNLVALAHEVFLKVQRAVGGVEHGRDAIVGHGQHAGANSHSAGKLRGHGAQRFARAQQVGAGEMGGEIEIAEAEPRGLAEVAPCARGSGSCRPRRPSRARR